MDSSVDPASIPYLFSLIPQECDDDPASTVHNPEDRLKSDPEGAAWIREEYGRFRFSWTSRFEDGQHGWHFVPVKILRKIFTFEELVRLWVSDPIESDLSRWIESEHPFLWKVSNVLWRYAYSNSYNLLVRTLRSLASLESGIDGLGVRIAHTRKYNMAGRAEHDVNLFLDAALAAVFYRKGEHVMTVSFAPCPSGVAVAQVQLRRKKGNRFLYSLPGHYVDYALGVLSRSFPDRDLLIVDGSSAVAAVKAAYGSSDCGMSPEDEARIAAIYDRDLESYVRGSETSQHEGRKYVRLTRGPRVDRPVLYGDAFLCKITHGPSSTPGSGSPASDGDAPAARPYTSSPTTSAHQGSHAV